MTVLVVALGGLIVLAGIVILVDPEAMFGRLRAHRNSAGLHVLAVVVRLVLGALLVTQADLSRFPLAIELLGWLAIVAAMVLAAIGRRNFQRLLVWVLSVVAPFQRAAGVFAAGFGAFLIYAFV